MAESLSHTSHRIWPLRQAWITPFLSCSNRVMEVTSASHFLSFVLQANSVRARVAAHYPVRRVLFFRRDLGLRLFSWCALELEHPYSRPSCRCKRDRR